MQGKGILWSTNDRVTLGQPGCDVSAEVCNGKIQIDRYSSEQASLGGTYRKKEAYGLFIS